MNVTRTARPGLFSLSCGGEGGGAGRPHPSGWGWKRSRPSSPSRRDYRKLHLII